MDWELAADLVIAMRDLCTNAGRTRDFILVCLPSGATRQDELSLSVDFARWKTRLVSRHIAVLDLNEQFEAMIRSGDLSRTDCFFHDGHPTPAYGKLVAKWLSNDLRNSVKD